MSAIKVVAYDPAWSDMFQAEKAALLSLLGNDVLEIHHVGSTAIPGLDAKPKIDIDLLVRSDEKVPEAVERVKTLSQYTFHGTPYNDGMWTFTSGHGSQGNRLYVCGPGNATHEKRIVFRDWLRTHPDDAAEYGALKRKLMVEAEGDWKYYTQGKSGFVASILAQASLSPGDAHSQM